MSLLDINTRIATQVKQLRDEHGWSIDHLAARTGVSRAMISKIERAESSPTASVLNKLAIGIGVTLPTLFGPTGFNQTRPPERNPVLLRARQTEWQDPESGYRRRTLTPDSVSQSMQLSEILLPAGCSMTVENSFGGKGVHQQIWMLEGRLELRIGVELRALAVGDCMAITQDGPVTFHNPAGQKARYLSAITGPGGSPQAQRNHRAKRRP
jgi:transcriptional regulator with XRE-family HTH domain